jgi:hypothetical protein
LTNDFESVDLKKAMETPVMRSIKSLISPLALLMLLLTASHAHGFELRGYADLNYARSFGNKGSIEENGAFMLGQLDLFMTQLIQNRIEVLAEAVIESDTEGNTEIDLERLQAGYVFNDWFKIHAGRFHNVLGYWNTAYHHGRIFQTTIARPQFLAFEDRGGILPVHIVGVQVSGDIRTNPVLIDYAVIAGNGSHIEPDDILGYALQPENTADPNKNKAISANLTLWPVFLPGLGFGVSSDHGIVPAFDGSTLNAPKIAQVSQQILGGHFVYLNSGRSPVDFEFLSEYYSFRNKDTFSDTGSYWASAYYIQGAIYILNRFIPYARYEHVNTRMDDPYFALLNTGDSIRKLVGIRFSQNVDSAIKAEVQWVDPEGQDHYTRYAVQWALAF